jgi:hypothetical protein
VVTRSGAVLGSARAPSNDKTNKPAKRAVAAAPEGAMVMWLMF